MLQRSPGLKDGALTELIREKDTGTSDGVLGAGRGNEQDGRAQGLGIPAEEADTRSPYVTTAAIAKGKLKMGDLYEDIPGQNGSYPDEELYEECGPEALPAPPPALPAVINTGHPNDRRTMAMPLPKHEAGKKHTQAVTVVIGDLQAKLESKSGGQAFGVPLRATAKPKDFPDQRASVRDKRTSMPPIPITQLAPALKPKPHESPAGSKRLSQPPSGGFRLPAASVVSSQRPMLRRVSAEEQNEVAKPGLQPPVKVKPSANKPPPMTSKPNKPAISLKPTSPGPGHGKTPEMPPTPPLPDQSSLHPLPPSLPSRSPELHPKPVQLSRHPPHVDYSQKSQPTPPPPQRPAQLTPPPPQQIPKQLTPPPPQPVSPSTIASPTPSTHSATGFANRYRRLPLASVDLNNPPPVPLASKPRLPPKDGMPQEELPPLPPSDPSAGTTHGNMSRINSVRRPPPSSSPPTLPPPPPPVASQEVETDDVYENSENFADDRMPKRSDEDLEEDIDAMLATMGEQPVPLPPQPPPPLEPPPLEPPPPDDEITEELYDDVEEISQQVRDALAVNPPPPDDTYEVTGPDDNGLPPPSEELYDEVPGGVNDAGTDDFHNDGSESDVIECESEDWSNDDLDDDPPEDKFDAAPPETEASTPGLSEPTTTMKKKKRKSKDKKMEKKKKEEEKLAAKRREKEEKEQQRQREKEEKERQKQLEKERIERNKLIAKQRKFFKVNADENKVGVVRAKSTCKGGPDYYLRYKGGEMFDVLLKESDKKRKLPPNTWLVQRQEDGTIGYIEVINIVEENGTDDFGYGNESLYEDVGQGAPVTIGAASPTTVGGYALSTGLSPSHHSPVNIPPPSMRAPPLPGVPSSYAPEESEALYEDLPCNQ